MKIFPLMAVKGVRENELEAELDYIYEIMADAYYHFNEKYMHVEPCGDFYSIKIKLNWSPYIRRKAERLDEAGYVLFTCDTHDIFDYRILN